ncbi:hypothetical protein Sjap_016707 [Stephania japonica]|uniref:Uncharacterized protein n=1 Tax=Stephania japonica TaxID=461633 RepID=A0AAP0NU34_9MAGN
MNLVWRKHSNPWNIEEFSTGSSAGPVVQELQQVVHILASKGINVILFKLKYTVDFVQGIPNFTMDVDMLSHFDKWQRNGQGDVYEAQEQWPVELRRARISAVDYLQAQRARGKLIR